MHSAYVGDPDTALQLSDRVLETRQSLTPRVRALFYIRRARALAQLGDARGADAALAQAVSLYDDGVRDADPPWAWWITPHEIACHRAYMFAAGNQWSKTLETFAESLELVNAAYPRQKYAHAASIAFAAAVVTDSDALEKALDLAYLFVDEVGSARSAVNLANAARQVRRKRSQFPSSMVDKAETVVRRLGLRYDLPALLGKVPALADTMR